MEAVMRVRKPRKKDFVRAAKWTTAGALAVQAGAVASVVAIDKARQHRTPPSGRFPHMPPISTQVDDNAMRIYTYGRDLYEDMLDDIRSAKERIYFECFIVRADETGQEFREALIDAAQRGVETYIVLDTWGNINQNPFFRHFPKMPHLHVTLFPFVRLGIFTQRAHDKGRDHRKILAVDGKVGYVGGYNIGTLFAEHWRDTHVRIEGPAVWGLEQAFVSMWNSYRKDKSQSLTIEGIPEWDAKVRTVLNMPSQGVYPIASTYLDAMNRASERAWITMAYFLPDEAMLRALKRAARRGVDVRVLIPEYSNHIYVDWASRPHYKYLLDAGVRIFLFEEAMVHAKTMTVDGKWSTVGTANIDRLSRRGNFEINLEIYDDGFAQAMESVFEVDMGNSRELSLEEWEQRGTLARVTEKIIQPLSPLL
ncbi:MAG: phosphatidylserine/phosphatidylglycerophosphate/cardiolipin synthase family protein [Actinomycetaceae bacterium]|nr:phosphatidylserine/phosphatidylglycerophosphate/cardiolipin synthase family protein [Actinomycetaceae bacterium]